MQLPEIPLPKIDLPFDISLLIHPPVVHFAIVLPVIILLLEFYNLFVKRRSIGVFSFILIVMTVIVFIAAYLTGSVDGKEALDLLSEDGQTELKGHKLLGTYLMFVSMIILILKLLVMTGKTFFKVLFFIVLIVLIILTFKQGKDGGELVYEYGANIESVKDLKDDMSDIKEELEEAQETISKMKASRAPTIVKPKRTVTVEKMLEETPKKIQEQDEKVLKTLQDAAKDVSKKVHTRIPSPTKLETNNTSADVSRKVHTRISSPTKLETNNTSE